MQRTSLIALLSLLASGACASLAFVYRQELMAERKANAESAARAGALEKQLAQSTAPTPVLPVVHSDWDTNQVAELQAKLAAQEQELSALRSAASNAVVAAAAPVIPDAMPPVATNAPDRRRSWMEDLQANDPERYKEIMERREQARQEARYDIAKKAAFFLQQPSESMNDAEAEEYTRMMNLLTESLKLTEKLDAGLEGDDRREIMRSLRDNLRELSPMLETERSKEFYQVGKDLGYSDQDAQAFAQYLDEVIDLTSVNSIFRNAMRGMGGWGGGPPPGERDSRP